MNTHDVFVRRIGAGEISFHGYAEAEVERRFGRVDLRPAGETPAILEFADAILDPRYECLHDLAGRRIEQTRATWLDPDIPSVAALDAKLARKDEKRSPPAITPPAAPAVVEAPVVLLGKVHLHYGHFLTDTLARFWALDRLDPSWKVVFAPANPAGLELPYVRWVLDRIGVEPSRILSPKAPTLFRRLVCPMPALQQSRRMYRDFDRPHLIAAAKVMADAKPTWTGRSVYLTRSGFGGGLRSVLGEDELETRMQAAGYAIVQPERLPMEEQIALFNQADRIVAVRGSALHTALFRLPDAPPLRIAALSPHTFQGRNFLQDGLKGLRTAYLHCMEELPPTPGQEAKALLRVDAARAADLLDQAGFLTAP